MEIELVYDNAGTTPGDSRSRVVEVYENPGTYTFEDSANGHTGVFEVVWNTVSGDIEISLLSGTGTATADICQYSGGTIINNYGTITNNYDTNEYNTNVSQFFD